MHNIDYMVTIYDVINNQTNIISNDTNDINGLLSNYGIERIFIASNATLALNALS